MSLLAMVPAGQIGALVVSNLVVFVIDVLAARRVWHAGAERFRFGSCAKVAWIMVIFGVTWHLGVVAFPVGALLARSRLWSPPASDAGPVLFAEGQAGWPEDLQ